MSDQDRHDQGQKDGARAGFGDRVIVANVYSKDDPYRKGFENAVEQQTPESRDKALDEAAFKF